MDRKENGERSENKSSKKSAPKFISEQELKDNNWAGMAKNVSVFPLFGWFWLCFYFLRKYFRSLYWTQLQTGPKGVIKDWQRFKQLEHEKNQENEKERRTLAKKLAMTCRSDDLDKDTINKEAKNSQEDNLESDLLQDEFLKEYLSFFKNSFLTVLKTTAIPSYLTANWIWLVIDSVRYESIKIIK